MIFHWSWDVLYCITGLISNNYSNVLEDNKQCGCILWAFFLQKSHLNLLTNDIYDLHTVLHVMDKVYFFKSSNLSVFILFV